MSVTGNTTLRFSEEQAMLLDVSRQFCRDRAPMSVVREWLESETGFDPATWQEMVDLGWTGIALPEVCGGSGLGVSGVVPVVEAMGRAMLGTPLVSSALAGQLLLRAAGPGQQEGTLAEIAAGTPATVALLENGDWGDDRVACTVEGDSVLRGAKRFVTDAGVAQIFVVAVQCQGAPALAVVRADALEEGAISPNALIDLTRRAATVDFDGAVVATGDLVTGDRVPAALRDLRLLGALLSAAEAVGSAAACLDTIVEYLRTRRQFGRLIGSYQALKHPAVEILTGVEDSRSFVYHAATLAGAEPLGRDAEIACRMAKAQATETLAYAGDRAVQFHGGMGFTWECDAQLFIRRAQWIQQHFGDAQHHRKRLAALLFG